MTPKNRFSFPWLVDNTCRNKALIKFDIRQLEAKLHSQLNRGGLSARNHEQILSLCSQLHIRYADFLLIIAPDIDCPKSDYIVAKDEHFSQCYAQLCEHKKQVAQVILIKDEVSAVLGVWHYYKKLEMLLQRGIEIAIPRNQNELDEQFKRMMLEKKPEAWLQVFINFANTVGENSIALTSQFAKLDDEQFTKFNELIASPEFVSLFNTILFYKINPCNLYDFSMHPEKMISVINRLTTLYHFIEFFQQSLLRGLMQRGINNGYDYLFHGDELPDGIIVEADEQYREVIIEAIKHWQVMHIIDSDESLCRGRLVEIFRAYKFWFNPNRLIDAVVSLEQDFSINLSGQDGHELFNQRMHLIYQQLSTTECLDLYGYFANKDSRYLMRSLQAASLGHQIVNFPMLKPAEQAKVRQIYTVLECVMNSLRRELECRSISTVPYERDFKAKVIRPGRRNLQALCRILSLYGDNSAEENQRLNALFKEVEG